MALTKVSSALFEGDSPTFTELATLTGTTPQLDFKQTSGAHILASVRAEVDSGTGGKLVISTKRDGDAAVDRLTIDDDGASTFSGSVTATSLDISGNIDVDGVTNLDVVDIDGAVDMASTLTMSAGGTISAGGLNDLVLNAGASGTPDIYLQSASSTKVKIEGSTGAATFSDDITLGGTTHRVWGSGYNTVQLDTSAMLYGNASSISTASNLYYNSGWKHVATGAIGINVNEAGYHTFYTGPSGSAGAAASFNQRLSINPAGNITINEDGVDADFRVESNEHTHALFVDGGNNTVGIDQSSPTYLLDVGNSSSAPANGNVMRINSNGDTIFSLSKAGTSLFSMRNNANSYTALSSNSGADLLLGHSASGAGAIVDHLRFRATSTVFNEDGVDRDFRVESDTKPHALFVNGANGNIGINDNSPSGIGGATVLDVVGNTSQHGQVIVEGDNGTQFLVSNSGIASSNVSSLYANNGIRLATATNKDATGFVERLAISTSGVVINENGVDADFRVESNGNANMLFVDGGNNQVGVGTASALGATLNVLGGITNSTMFDAMVLTGGANSTSGSGARLYISGTANDPIARGTIIEGKMVDNGNTHELSFYVSGNSAVPTRRMTIGHSAVVINEDGLDMDFRVESDTGTHMLFVDGGGGFVTVGRETNLRSSILTVQSNNNAGLAIGYGTGTNECRRLYHHSSGLYFESSTNQAYLNAAGVWTDASDITYKKDIEDIDYGIETVKKLKPRKYKMKSDGQAQIGFVAQELVEQVPEIVSEKDGILGVAYGQLTAVLTKAIQEQQTLIESLEARLSALEA